MHHKKYAGNHFRRRYTNGRDFIYSTDVAEATICSAECSDASGLAINVGTGIATSINELAEVMFAIAGKGTLNVTRAPPRSGELAHSQVDTRLASKILNFESKVSLEAGLRKFLTWYESLPIISRTS